MDSRYVVWINQNVPMECTGLCSAMTEKMALDFPELHRVRGHYIVNGHQHPHWWCVDEDGTIVDPTARQFALGGKYIEHLGPEPIGKCCNCGEYAWTSEFGGQICSEDCHRQYTEYLMHG